MYSKLTLSKAIKHIWSAINKVWLETEDWDMDSSEHHDFTTLIASLWRMHTHLKLVKQYDLEKHHNEIKQELSEEVETFDEAMEQLMINDHCDEFTSAIMYVDSQVSKLRRTLKLKLPSRSEEIREMIDHIEPVSRFK